MNKSLQLNKSEKRALKSVYELGIATRSEIATHSGLGTRTAGSTIDALIQDGWIEMRGLSASTRGRPSQQYGLNPELGYSVGLSFDFESIRILAVNTQKKILHESELPMKLTGDGPRNTTDTNDFFGTIPDMIEKFIYANSLKSENLLSVGIALPGMIDTERGIWLHGMRIPNVHHIKLRDMVKTRFDLLVLVEDVARAVTHLQSRIGLGKGVRDFVLLHIGMGFGSGIVINKKIYRGHHGTAGEIGHMVVDPNGYRCGCGKRGCLDTVVSIPGILRTMADRRKEVTHSPLGAPFYQSTAPLSIESILQSAQSGDRFTISFLGEIGTIIADACERMVMILNPQMIIIAGHCAILEPFLKDPIDHRLKSIVLPDLLSGFTVKFAPYSPNDESYGAALLALDDYWNSA